jgi:hypothetical protein
MRVRYATGGSGAQFTSVLHNFLIFYHFLITNSNNHLRFLYLCRLQQLAMPSRLTVVFVSLLLTIPAFTFWLWLVILPASVAKHCPEECRCSAGGYYVDCSRASLKEIPLILPTHVRELLLDNNSITLLKNDSFVSRGLTELESLQADFCQIGTIELGAFNGLTKLIYLSMWGNEISEILPGTFEKVIRLEYLDLDQNVIEHLEVDVFSGLNNLKYVFLTNNKLQYLNSDIFLGLPKLEAVYVGNNRRLQVPTDGLFIKSHSLSSLDISDCNIISVSVQTFANASALERLDLSCNNLRSVDINILKELPKLSALYLYGNPLHCDCQLQEVWRWCHDHNIKTEYVGKAPECDTPNEVQGMLWGVVEKGQCLQGNIHYYGDYKNTSYSYTPSEDMDTDTGLEQYGYIPSSLTQYQAPIYAVLFIFGTTGNVILIIIITCNKDTRTVQNMYILNLAISDLFKLTVFLFEACANSISVTWLDGEFMCTFFPFCRRLSVGLSAYSLAVLSIRRYRVIANPFHVLFSSQPTWRSTAATICGVWIVAALFALPAAYSKYLCRESIILGFRTYYQHVVVFELFVSCVLPLCVIAFSYIMAARHLVESAVFISHWTRSSLLQRRKYTAKIMVGLTFVFLISYLPYHALWTHIIATDKQKISDVKIIEINPHKNHKLGKIISSKDYKLEYSYIVSTCLLLINSCLNPVAQFGTSFVFRSKLKSFLTCCKTNSTPTDLELRRRI